MEMIDRTDPYRKMRRHTRRLPGVMPKTIIWFEEVGAERIPQKSIKIMRSAYKKTIDNYWRTLDPRYLDRAQRMRHYTQSSENND
jgi:hypothetical protein